MANESSSQDRWGPHTRWTLIRNASAEGDDEGAGQAWNELVERYREPVAGAVKRLMRHHPNADEVAEDFFSYLYSKKVLEKAEPGLGRFRCFIQGVIKRYVKQASRPARSATIDTSEIDVAAPDVPPEAEQREEAEWAMSVLKHATKALVAQVPRDGKLLLKAFGIAPYKVTPRRKLCKDTGLTMNALNVAIHRAREKLRHLIVAELRETVATEADLELESGIIGKRLTEVRPELLGDDESFIEWAENPD